MRSLSLIVLILVISFAAKAQESPHGERFALSCTYCHTTQGWEFVSTGKFNHDSTRFLLEGQHKFTNCRLCHTSLVFSETKSNCNDCHTDMHNNTVGMDCSRCHNPQSWIISNITEIHQTSRFPLLGAHNSADCSACHNSASRLEFEPLGIECFDCHQQDYLATTDPNHSQTGLSTDCIECHKIDAHEWSASGINHDFFPLTKGHEIPECSACHTSGVTQSPPTDCFACHLNDYQQATNPNHANNGFSQQCNDCHTTNPDWKPAEFGIHDDLYFPIFSGKHRGEWNSCTDCHSNPENYTLFSCTDCHEHNKNDMDDEHRGINGYSYNSMACFACHPSGDEETAFNHDNTGFQLKGAHLQNDCLDCHKTGFSGTSSFCYSCHAVNYSETQNPLHVSAGIAKDCETCHNETDWIPSLFIHAEKSGFELSGGHAGKQCSECHQGTTSNASPDCYSCHAANYASAENHAALNYPTACLQCHTTNSWEENNFDHNATSFPLTGSHLATECSACHTEHYAETPTQCSACHTENYNLAQNPVHTAAGISTECETCHETSSWILSIFNHTTTTGFELSGGHAGKQCSECHQGTTSNASPDCYSCHAANYASAENHAALNYPTACLQCHTTNSWEENNFDHNATSFPLTGSHLATECSACHINGYTGTSTLCIDCHRTNFEKSVNPNHITHGLSTTCEDCHNTGPGWEPALFPVHNDFYQLNGAHATISSNCYLCHNGNYNNTPNTCFACHTNDYNNTTNPNHLSAQFSTDCETCHSETAWSPSTFDHDNQYFPIYSGKHRGKWNNCIDCHTTAGNYAVFSCTDCHEHNLTEMNAKHREVNNYVYSSASCFACHPTGNDDD